jgi:hypothetical protein
MKKVVIPSCSREQELVLKSLLHLLFPESEVHVFEEDTDTSPNSNKRSAVYADLKDPFV